MTMGTRDARRNTSRTERPGPAEHADLGLLLASCSERLVRALLATLAEAGYAHLTSSQAITVMLVGEGTNTVTQIADRLGVTTQAVSKICGVLYTERLVDREPHADDGRSRRLALTTEGQRVRDLMERAGADAERFWAELVGAQTLETVRQALAAYAATPDPAPPPASSLRIRFA